MTLPFRGPSRRSPKPEATSCATTDASEQTLLARLTAGDTEAFETLFHRHYATVCSVAHRCVGSADIAEDLAQEVFLYAWRQRGSLEIRDSFRAYLCSAVRNAATSHARHSRVVDRRVGDIVALFDRPPVTPDRALAASEADAELRRALDRLPDRCRLVFTLQREQGLTYAEVAQTLGISIKTVDVQMGRALKVLRRLLGPNWP